MKRDVSRRDFLASATAAGVGLSLAAGAAPAAEDNRPSDKPALLGGKPAHTAAFPSWPQVQPQAEKNVGEVLRSGKWFRGGGQQVNRFEEAFARLYGAKHCIATANGTSALIASLGALCVGAGDEVIVSPYTFIATVNAILMHHALPVFVDTDPETFQIDHRKIEAAVSDRTVAILPVHIGGSPANLDAILEVGQRHKLPVVEDACQSILGQWRGRKLGTWGATGCFSFQVTKNLCSGEGGAILTDDDALAERCYAFHNNCRARTIVNFNFSYTGTRAANFRMTEFQGALLQAQMTRIEEQSRIRHDNALYLSAQLKEIAGIVPAKLYDGCTRGGWHLYMFRYQPEMFAGLSRAKFLQALSAEGVPCSSGYAPLNWESFIHDAVKSRGYQRAFSKETLDRWPERTRCPANDKLCSEAVWFTQTMLLAPRCEMDQIAAAVRKIQKHAGELAKMA